MATDWDAVGDQLVKQRAVTNVTTGANVAPQAAVDAINNAPTSGVPASVGMHAPTEGNDMALFHGHTAILNASPEVASFAASDPAKAAATKDDFSSLAGIAHTVNRWNDTATADFFAPGTAAIHSLMRDVPRWFQDTGKGSGSPLDMIPGFSPKDQKLGSIVADLAGIAFSPASGALYAAARPFSYIPMQDQHGNAISQPERQNKVAEIFGTALMGLGAGGARAPGVRPPPINEGTFGAKPRLTGPTEQVPDAQFTETPSPGVDPNATPIHTSIAEVDAHNVSLMQNAIAESATHSRSPQLMIDYLENHTAAGGTTVSVPAESITQLWQQGHEVFQDQAESIGDALSSGGDVQVPLSQYLTETAGQSFAEELNAATRFRETGVSQDEAKGLPQPPELNTTVEAAAPPAKPEVPADMVEHTEHIQAIAARADFAIERVFKETSLDKLFTEPSATGLTKGQFERFAERVEESRTIIRDKLLENTYRQIKRERTPEWKAAVDLHVEEAHNLIEAQPNVQAFRAVKDPLFKIDTEKAAELYPDLPLPKELTKRGGLSPDEAAELTGHSSGSALVQDLHHLSQAVAAHGGTLNDYVKNRAGVYAEEQARQMLGYDVTPDGMLTAAREAMIESPIEDLLTADLKELAEAAGLPFDKKLVETQARDMFSRLLTKEAAKPKAFAENMRRLGNKAEALVMDERPIKAFQVKQQQYLQFLQMREAFTFQKELARGTKMLTQLAKKPITAGMDQTARNQLRWIAREVGFKINTGKFEGVDEALKGQSLEAYVNSMRSRGFDPAFATIPRQDIADMTVDQFRGVAETVKSIAQLGRWEKKAFNEGKARELAEIGAEVKENANAIGRPFTAGELHRLKGKVAGAPSAIGRAVGAAVSRPETFLFWLDREANGPLMKYLVGELQDGKYYKTDKINSIGEKFRDFVKSQPKGWQHSLEEMVDVPELTYSRGRDGQPIPWLRDRGNVIMMATHFGTESNFQKLAEGFGWDTQTVREVANRVLTEADWKYVQHILDMNKSLLPEVQSLYRATVGLAMKELPATPIQTPFGELPGGYRHISYDWNAIEETEGPDGEPVMQEDPTSLHASDLFGPEFRTATPPNAYTLERTHFSAPLNLEHSILHREIESVIHDLAYRKALIQATKIMRQPQVRQAVREALGPEYGETINNWLKDIARGSSYDQTVLKNGAALIRGIRRRFTIVQIGYNVATLMKHGGIAAAHISGEVGVPEFARASADLMKDQDLQKWVDEQSGEVRGSLMNLDRDVRELMQDIFRKQGYIENWRYHAFTMFGAVKRVEAMATWLAKYRNLSDTGLPHADAVSLANKAVRDTQGAGSPVDLPSLWRGNASFWAEVGKLMNIFTGFENTASNRMWTMIRRGGGAGKPPSGPKGYEDAGWAGGRRDFNKQMSGLLSYFVFPALWATAFDTVTQGKLHKGAKFGAVFLEHFLENTLKGLLGGSVPMGNMLAEIPQMIKTRDWKTATPLNDMFGTTVGTAVNAWDAATGHKNKVEDRWVQHAMETAGYIFNLPVKPLAKGGQYLWDKSQGHVKDKSLAEFFRGLVFGPTSEQAKKHR